MYCPVCNAGLMPVVRQGIEIDHCPGCRGVWMDRGELDRLIERSAGFPDGGDSGEWEAPARGHRDGDHPRPPRRRESFWQRMFDLD